MDSERIYSTTASVPLSIPCLSCMGFAPAARFFSPSLTIACASTVAVVVPSPATSFVRVAASLSNCAPIFSKAFSSWISLATVTPSCVTVGAPNFLSSATLRPFGPSVALTAPARISMPFFSDRRASSSNISCLAIRYVLLCFNLLALANNGENVVFLQDQVFLAIEFELGAAILGIQHAVAFANIHRGTVAVIQQTASADRDNGAFLGLL